PVAGSRPLRGASALGGSARGGPRRSGPGTAQQPDLRPPGLDDSGRGAGLDQHTHYPFRGLLRPGDADGHRHAAPRTRSDAAAPRARPDDVPRPEAGPIGRPYDPAVLTNPTKKGG